MFFEPAKTFARIFLSFAIVYFISQNLPTETHAPLIELLFARYFAAGDVLVVTVDSPQSEQAMREGVNPSDS